MSGAAMAYHLTRGRHDQTTPSIVMLEARQVCSGATGRNGGHVKVKTDTMLNMIEQDGYDRSEEFGDLVIKHIYALKEVVEREGLECEFEMRRSYDVFLTDAEAQRAKGRFEACRRAGQKWTREVDLIGEEFAQRVSTLRRERWTSTIVLIWKQR